MEKLLWNICFLKNSEKKIYTFELKLEITKKNNLIKKINDYL